MRILVLTHRWPYPPDKGERIRAFQWLRALSGRHEVDLLSLDDGEVDDSRIEALRKMVHSAELFRVRRRLGPVRIAAALLGGKSFTQGHFASRQFATALEAKLAGGEYDLCLAVCSSTGVYCAAAPGALPRLVIDLVDVDSLKWEMYSRRHGGAGGWVYRREARKLRLLETELGKLAQKVVVVSPYEAQQMREICPTANVQVISNGVDTDYFQPRGDAGRIDSIVFVGQMDYWPNIDAVRWFAREVWPGVSRVFGRLKFIIVGRDPAAEVRRLNALPNVTVTGTVGDVRPYLERAISVAPFQVACGVQNKVLEAMAAGRPAIISPTVAKGLDVRPGEEALIATSPAQWADAIKLLVTDPALTASLGAKARAAMLERYNWDISGQSMRRCLEQAEQPKAASTA